MIAALTCPWCGEESHRNGEVCAVAVRSIVLAAKEGPVGPETIKPAARADGADPSNDGLSAAYDALGNQSEELPAFEVRRISADGKLVHVWKVFWHGVAEGFDCGTEAQILINRIPELMRRARADGWADHRYRTKMLTREELAPRARSVWFAGWRNGFGLAASIAVLLAVLADLLLFH